MGYMDQKKNSSTVADAISNESRNEHTAAGCLKRPRCILLMANNDSEVLAEHNHRFLKRFRS